MKAVPCESLGERHHKIGQELSVGIEGHHYMTPVACPQCLVECWAEIGEAVVPLEVWRHAAAFRGRETAVLVLGGTCCSSDMTSEINQQICSTFTNGNSESAGLVQKRSMY